MADTSGFFLKGFAGAIRGMPQRIYEVRWRKKQEDALQKKQDELIELTSLYSKTAEQLGNDGFYSDDDLMKLNTIVITGGTEFQEIIKGTHSHIQGMNESQVKKDMDLVDSFIEMSKSMNLKDLDETLEMIRGFVKSETALNKLAAYDSLYKKKHELQPKAETFPTAAGVQKAYPGAGVKYMEEGYVPVIGEEVAPKAPSAADRKLDMVIDQYAKDLITFDQLSKYLGTLITPEKTTGLEKKIQDIRTQGKAAGIPEDQINTAIKNEIVGIDIVGEPFNLNDFLFGSNGIMKDYSTGGGKLMPEDIEAIKNNYNIKKNLLLKENQEQVEEFLFDSGIDVNAPIPEPVLEPEPEPSIIQKGIKGVQDWLGKKGETIESRRGLEVPTPEGVSKPREIPTPKVPTGEKEAMIPLMSREELEDAIKGLDPSDPMYKSLYNEAVKRGYITK